MVKPFKILLAPIVFIGFWVASLLLLILLIALATIAGLLPFPSMELARAVGYYVVLGSLVLSSIGTLLWLNGFWK